MLDLINTLNDKQKEGLARWMDTLSAASLIAFVAGVFRDEAAFVTGTIRGEPLSYFAVIVAAVLLGSLAAFCPWPAEGQFMTLFTATLVVIAVLATVGATYVWWPRSHVGEHKPGTPLKS